jgi:FlaA1/EpsC-like NDP-sugar epimerase
VPLRPYFSRWQGKHLSDLTKQASGNAGNSTERTGENQSAPAFLFPFRTIAVYGIETAIIICAAILSFVLRFDLSMPAYYRPILTSALMVWIPVKLVAFRLCGLDKRWARYVSLSDLTQLVLSNTIGTTVSLAILWAWGLGVPRSVYAIDFLLCLIFTTGSRASVRLAFESIQTRRGVVEPKRTLVYGAGNAGVSLLRDLRKNTLLPYRVCGLIDDSPQKQGLLLHGVRVLGTGDDLASVHRKYRADLVLIAIPSASGTQLTAIIERCSEAGLEYKTVPGLAEIIADKGIEAQIRDVAVEDLLGRHPVALDQGMIEGQLAGRVVLVTGAAGSIGSEICRQLARFGPAAIIGFEIAESPLFNLQLEMKRRFSSVCFEAEIGSIQNLARLREVFTRYRPEVVYHAAAYKHVPLMEVHLFEAVENNVFGTLNLVETAREFGVTEFVMISTDKAVRPTNIMGATKRIAETLVRSLQPDGSRFVSVRFGNVLGSNGSVVPIFKEQIARGGPITVTHPEMRRYFMTIPEACQLVLQASTMGKGGEIFVLDMSEPVRIVDLARNLILLSGLRPNIDIKIEFTGIRPGEKLFEELNAEGEGMLPTHHEKIKVFSSPTLPWPELESRLRRIRTCCQSREGDDLIDLIREAVPDYTSEGFVGRHTPSGV